MQANEQVAASAIAQLLPSPSTTWLAPSLTLQVTKEAKFINRWRHSKKGGGRGGGGGKAGERGIQRHRFIGIMASFNEYDDDDDDDDDDDNLKLVEELKLIR